jgi:hypothetical protein
MCVDRILVLPHTSPDYLFMFFFLCAFSVSTGAAPTDMTWDATDLPRTSPIDAGEGVLRMHRRKLRTGKLDPKPTFNIEIEPVNERRAQIADFG